MHVRESKSVHRQRRALWALVLSVSMALAACGSDSGASSEGAAEGGTEAAGPDRVRLLQAAPNSMVFNVLFVGDELGYFEEENIEVVEQDAGDMAEVAFLDNGQTDVAFTGAADVLQGLQAGVDLRIIYEYWQTAIEGIVVPADSEIESVADLEGGTVGLASESDLAILNIALDLVGLSEDDVEWIIVGEQGGVIASAFDDGTIDAMAGSTRDFRSLIGAGVDLRQIEPQEMNEIPGQAFIIMADQIDEQQDVLERFFRAWAKATHASFQNDEALLAMGEIHIPEAVRDPVQAQVGLDQAKTGSRPLTDNYGQLRPEAWENSVEFLLSSGGLEEDIPVVDYLDDRFIEPANDWDRSEVEADVEAWAEENL